MASRIRAKYLSKIRANCTAKTRTPKTVDLDASFVLMLNRQAHRTHSSCGETVTLIILNVVGLIYSSAPRCDALIRRKPVCRIDRDGRPSTENLQEPHLPLTPRSRPPQDLPMFPPFHHFAMGILHVFGCCFMERSMKSIHFYSLSSHPS
ncbi:hypothetical protein LIPSTDRAFT_244901 [Lipomyces starkeyi NRRL Y-11557]|uniref:Uncharacterized protein n=1 Tax=Lipomyces starkeyi NRRL Y-11557 TaxID=675824 RepID=A0A1E3Q906_LIPST|nr:hypothetical protein LIPSTDRAFT_244901 [Lipomyces starkeyi NRRL Y-11557]